MELSTDQKGAIAESAIGHAAIKLGIGVLKPLTDGHRYDLVFDLAAGLSVSSASGARWFVMSWLSLVTRAVERETGS